MSCRQIESLPEDTDVVLFTYHLNGHYIELGQEEFCLITRLRVGLEYSDHYVEGTNPFKRLLFGSDIDGGHITGQMLLDKINSEEFSKMQDEDAVADCQLAVLHLNVNEGKEMIFLRRGYGRHIKYWPLDIIHINCVILEILLGLMLRDSNEKISRIFLMMQCIVERKTFPSKYQLSPYTCLPETMVSPKIWANNIRNTRNAKVLTFNLGNACIDINSQVEELMYLGSSATDDYISSHNVDHTKQIYCWMKLMIRARPDGAWYTVAKTGTSSMLEMLGKFLIETNFHLMGMLDGSSRPYPSWDKLDIVYMPINIGGSHWVTEKAGHFERTGRRPYNFELLYNQGFSRALNKEIVRIVELLRVG
nr:hypothetical protein [Tanacetum cinerariifolium]